MKKILVLALGITLVAAACNSASSSTSGSQTTQQQVQSGNVEIDMTANGFSPDNITVKSGTVVTFKNLDSAPHWPASDPHPTHTDLPGFDALKGLNQGETYSFTFTQLGKWGFHDHLNSFRQGKITVVQ
jgi:plastocyanin